MILSLTSDICDITKGDILVNITTVSHRLKEFAVFHKVENQMIVTKRSKTKVPEINNDMAYLLGVITGDGSMVKSKRTRGGFHYIVRITSDSKFYLAYLSYLFRSYFDVNSRIVKDKRKMNTFDLVVNNAAVFWYLNLHGLPIGKKKGLAIPRALNGRNLKMNFIAGLADTDGYVDHNRIHLKQKDKNFLEILYNELNRLGMNCATPRVNYTNMIPFYYIRFDNKIPLRYASVAQSGRAPVL